LVDDKEGQQIEKAGRDDADDEFLRAWSSAYV
jgi:hypothetical protein